LLIVGIRHQLYRAKASVLQDEGRWPFAVLWIREVPGVAGLPITQVLCRALPFWTICLLAKSALFTEAEG
jgi:hypothetical protein